MGLRIWDILLIIYILLYMLGFLFLIYCFVMDFFDFNFVFLDVSMDGMVSDDFNFVSMLFWIGVFVVEIVENNEENDDIEFYYFELDYLVFCGNSDYNIMFKIIVLFEV